MEKMSELVRAPGRAPVVGMAHAFTGHYLSARLLGRFLAEAGATVIQSRVTTPDIISAGSTYASADFCLPLRVYIGHIHHLVERHPELDYILAPRILSEDGLASTCSKYRDIGGAVIRSLGGSVGYTLNQAGPEGNIPYLKAEETAAWRRRAARLPVVLQPEVQTLERQAMRNLCLDLYAQVFGLPAWSRWASFLPAWAQQRWAPHIEKVDRAFSRAYDQVVAGRTPAAAGILADESRPRLGLVGRNYLVGDPALTAGLKQFFTRAGVAVLTAYDVPFAELEAAYRRSRGYYDTHRLYEAFIEWAQAHVDGFIVVGSFGCHPDSFMNDYLADRVREYGLPCWVLKYDELTGDAGFRTRYETILRFLEERRDRRLQRRGGGEGPAAGAGTPVPGGGAPPPDEPPPASRLPLIIWPDMGPTLNVPAEELFYQAGLSQYVQLPEPVSDRSLQAGNTRYTEACCPYAFSTGSLKQSIARALHRLEAEAAQSGRPVHPRRIILAMARGEGPCTFGWYAIAQQKHLPVEFAAACRRYGHSIEMATMGLDGVTDFVRQLARLGDSRKLRGIVQYIEAWEAGLDRLPRWRRLWLQLRLGASIRSLFRPTWQKLRAVEALHARSLIVRAHETEAGSTTRAYRQGLELLRAAHSPRAIRRALRQALALLQRLPQDREPKPRVVAVGEIYVALTSYANRGTLENLLGRAGIEVTMGVHLSRFIADSLAEMKRRSRVHQPLVRALRRFLASRNVRIMEQRNRGYSARPFAIHDVGGEGIKSVAEARRAVEAGADGIVHVYPFKCMPEGVVKDALAELAAFYGVHYLPLTFDKEHDIQRLKTEVDTFAALLHGRARAARDEIRRRQAMGRALTRLYDRYRRHRLVDS